MRKYPKCHRPTFGELDLAHMLFRARSILWLPGMLSRLCSLSVNFAIKRMINITVFNGVANGCLASGPNAAANSGSFTDLLLSLPSAALTKSSETIEWRSWNVINLSNYSVTAQEALSTLHPTRQ